MKKTLMTLFLVFMATKMAYAADTYTVDPAHSSVMFSVKHLVISTVKGQFKDFSGTLTWDTANPSSSSLGGKIMTASIDTSSADRDTHLKSADFFDAEKHPEITFLSNGIAKKDGGYVMSGLLIMRGVEKAVSFPCTVTDEVTDPWGKVRRGFSAELTVDRTNFDISWNKALDAGGLVVGNDVKVSLEFEFIKQ